MSVENTNNPPFDYADMSLYNGSRSPSTIHTRNTQIRRYFMKYLLQKAISVFKWNIPENWDKDYFLYTLFGLGYIAVLHTDEYGVICQGGALGGYNLYYRPDYIIITNPLITGTITAKLGRDCELIKVQPDYTGIMDLVGYYADLMAITAESLSLNILNVQSATIFGAENNAQALAFKKMFDKIAAGEPAVAVGKFLFNEDGSPKWFPFTQNVKESYVASDLLSDMRKIESMFDTDVGIPNANTDKRERLITSEVSANNVETQTRCELWLDNMRKGINRANKKYGLDITVDWRIPPETTARKEDENNVP